MLRIARADEVDFRNDISDVYTVNRFTKDVYKRQTVLPDSLIFRIKYFPPIAYS